MKQILFFVLVLSLIFPRLSAQTTTLVTVGADGKLLYKADAVGSVVPDFSAVGYKNSEEPIPHVPVVLTINALAGDNSNHIQAAISQVAAMPLQASGFRGAILLRAGTYDIASRININASGIVLRGEGLATELRATGTTQYDLIRIDGGSVTVNSATQKKITDAFVPIGAKTITVESGHNFVAGDWVYVRREPNEAWISMLGMDKIARPAYPDVVNWVAADYKVNYERQILAVDGNRLTLDAPMMDIIDPLYAEGFVSKINSTRISNVGIENMKMISTYSTSWPSSETGVNHDEQHGWNAVRIGNARDCWVKKVTAWHFGFACVNIGSAASFVTVDSCAMYDPISKIDGGRRYSFNVDGQRSLVQNCVARNGRHDYANGARVAGPNVFYKNTATLQRADMGPHHRWATGILYDNITGNGQLFVQDRDYQGTGHGWAGSQIMFWNCKANRIIIQSPQSHHTNWAIGCTAPTISNVGQWVTRAWGVVESNNNPIKAIPSLFVAQRNERLQNIVAIPEIEFNAENLVPNGNFEIWSNKTTAMPESWTRGAGALGTNYFYAADTEQGNVLHLVDADPTTVAARRFNTSGNVDIPSAGIFRVSFKAKGNVGLRAVVLVKGTASPNTTTPSATNHIAAITDYPSGTLVDEWSTLMYDISIPSTATFGNDYKLHFSWSSSATNKPTCDFYIDDIVLQSNIHFSTSTKATKGTEPLVLASQGEIVFVNVYNMAFAVFSINGHKVSEGVANNQHRVPLPRGVYVVRINHQTQKVVL
jgi:hypothetical protein